MADPILIEAPPPPPPPPPPENPNFSTEFDSLPIPPLDPMFFSMDDPTSTEAFASDLDFALGDSGDFELTFDDLDDLYFPSEAEPFLIPNAFDSTPSGSLEPRGSAPAQPIHPNHTDFAAQISNPQLPPESGSRQGCFGHFGPEAAVVSNSPWDKSSDEARVSNSGSPRSGSSGISGDRCLDVDRYLNYSSAESGNCNLDHARPVSSQNSGDESLHSSRKLNSPSPVSSQSSENCGSGVSEAMNSPSPDSGNFVVDQEIKVEEMEKNSISKRKKENEDTNGESRTSKYRRSSLPMENANSQSGFSAVDEEEEKKKARLMRNRESAQLSRQRKKHYVEELEDKVRILHSTIAELNGKISFFMAENASLRQQLSSGGMCPPPPGMYPHPPMAPMPYPWMPCAPYMVKAQGSQVPLVPIPRLKPQQPLSAPKAKKSENKKSDGKTKKVASISFLGFLFFILLFGGLVPMVNVKYGGIRDKVSGGSAYGSDVFYNQHRGRVLRVNGHLNGSDESLGIGFSSRELDIGNRIHCERGHTAGSEYDVEHKERGSRPVHGSDEFVRLGNDSEPLVASLYVPRNDKLVKIDGNLIIHSVLASEKAMASRVPAERKNGRETGLAIPGDFSPVLAIPEVRGKGGMHSHVYRNPTERKRALSSGSSDTLRDQFKSTAADGKLQQWFREGLAGPMLSSGMCTEVFQFDVAPVSAAGAIVPASSVTNNSAEHRQNATHLNKGRNRRILNGLPVPLEGSNLNVTGEHVGRNPQKGNFQGNKTAASMVVSVLVDPREAGDGEIEGMIAPKSLPRIFVVVLIDSVKYVTYSCVLPRSGHHLVTT